MEPAPIAVLGLGCRFPGASDPMAFWSLLESGGDAIGPPCARRLRTLRDAGDAPLPRSGFLRDPAAFDPEFFGLSRAAAANLDPRQSLLLELAWEAFEDGGVKPATLRGTSTGVFVGATWHSEGAAGGSLLDQEASLIPGRISHQFGLRGPSVMVDTSTSSSLMAVHLACQSLREGDADLALAGGVNLFRSTREWAALEALGVLSSEGCSRPFDREASGYVRGEGGGLALLKPLDDALRDGDHIYCVIVSSAMNHNGQTTGLASPSAPAQRDLIERAYRRAGVGLERVAYIEAHGTGTRAGDGAEWQALESLFGERHSTPLAVGSVKANIGHLEGAAGIAGLIKAALAAHRNAIPRPMNVTTPRFASNGLSLLMGGVAWPAGCDCCGVTSLGLSGANAHVVLSRPPEKVPRPHPAPPWPFVMSAHSEEALKRYANELLRWAEAWTDADIADVCYTAAVRRTHHAVRRAFFCGSREEFIAGLRREDTVEAARVFELGEQVDWREIFLDGGNWISLPPYTWQHEDRYEARAASESPAEVVPRLVANVLSLPAEGLDRGTRLIELGLDSLSALELESQLETEAGLQIPAPELLGPLAISDLIRRAESIRGLVT